MVEVLIASAIVFFALAALVVTQGLFATQTVDRTLQNSLIDAAAGALTRCQSVASTPSSLSFTYEGGLVVNVALTGSCNPPLDTCNEVRATASAKGKHRELTGQVCRLK